MKTLRLILGDQLNHNHSWYRETDDRVTYLMAEMRQETDYVTHHIQKVLGFFQSMRNFAAELEEKGHQVKYFRINDEDNTQQLESIISNTIEATEAECFEYQLPDEYRLDLQLKEITQNLEIKTATADTEHFLTSREELTEFFKGKKQLLMESFYRYMRKKHNILMDGKEPEGGKWNYDKSNRKKWKGEPEIPHERGFRKDLSGLLKEIEDAGVETIGTVDAGSFSWPTSRADALSVLNYFCKNLLVHFGDYQDAMHTKEKFLFHSRISFALNSKMIGPGETLEKVIGHYRKNGGEIELSQVEGFVRQVLGWREYMRGIYWKEMPSYANRNELDNKNPLPSFFWDADTRMSCLHHSIKQSLDDAYAHHIQRLMITGNYALLAQTDPAEVDQWYLGIYIDAIEWVELTNTRGMSQFADGGLLATKPYVSSANYINKMGNYCSECKYSHSKKTGENACPFNSLYWNFLHEKRPYFKDNQRMSLMLSLLDKIEPDELKAIRERAAKIIRNPGNF
ncbi:cryptochrome/photolyase family protein [Zeaxanthinibacter enoshimensis]|uniref:Deoxyribodipyrimidine photolyase-related protein n=1 Tax=Zeaxanthinibacter enoshimensis TaxID=392009 RepID=A0A4R6TIS5_9FLAO|nr:cryptochrome/photolyase family protein [Zeaxanthinibacter enoshimensis]TDQ30744.1 deoxyribodipyrimidine photolyase-related protein [Zeaxanthinibacter enoshimensis]